MFSWKAQLMHAVTMASAPTSTASSPLRRAILSAASAFPAARTDEPQHSERLRVCAGSTKEPAGKHVAQSVGELALFTIGARIVRAQDHRSRRIAFHHRSGGALVDAVAEIGQDARKHDHVDMRAPLVERQALAQRLHAIRARGDDALDPRACQMIAQLHLNDLISSSPSTS